MAPRKAAENLRLLLLKPVCPGCGGDRPPGDLLCGWCRLRLEPCRSALWSADGGRVDPRESWHPSASDDPRGIRVHPVFLYRGVPRGLVLRLKFGGERHLARPAAALMAEWAAVLPGPGDLLTPIPSGRRKLRERGYNQAALLSREVASRLSLPGADLLERDDGPSQIGLPSSERTANVRGVFRVRRRASLPGGVRTIWIVDDVATTCSTLHSAAGTLRAAFGIPVSALTLTYRSLDAGSMLPGTE